MRVDTHVSCRPRQALVLSVWDVFFGLWVDVLFGQAEINDVDGVLPFAARPPHQEILWLDVSVDQAFGVNILHPCDLGKEGGDPRGLQALGISKFHKRMDKRRLPS